MKSMYRLLCLMMWLPMAVAAQPTLESASVEPFSVRTLNTYEVLESPADLANHPLMNVEVTFTAVVNGIANNTGLPASNSPVVPGLARRLHLFVVDTMASVYGNYGMSMQIVEDMNSELAMPMADVLLSARRGAILTFTGRLTLFDTQIQFDLTQVPVPVGDVYQDSTYAHLRTVIEPHFIHSFMMNKADSLTGALGMDLSMYTMLAHSYVTLGQVRFDRYSQPGALRPDWAASDPFGRVYLYDSSSRFRNDREGLYWDIMNHRRAFGMEGLFEPPQTGTLGQVSGFVVYASILSQGMMLPPMAVLAPWSDGVLWQGTSITSPEWLPNDLVVDTTAVAEDRMVEFRVDTYSLRTQGLFDPMFDAMYVRGNFSGWDTVRMESVDWGIYSVTLPITGQEGDTLVYKYYYDRPTGDVFNGGWEVIGDDPMVNRIALLGPVGVPMSLPSQFSMGLPPATDTRLITFSVDMTPLAIHGFFDPAYDTMVSIAGSFSGWGTLPMQRMSDLVWSTTINMPGAVGDSIEYKFVYAREQGPLYNFGYELLDARELTDNIYVNRRLVLGAADVPMVLDVVPFGYIPVQPPLFIGLPVTFEEEGFDAAAGVTGFEGGFLTRSPNPDTTGINPSRHAGMLVKGPGQPWAGAFFRLSGAIDPMHRIFKMKVLAPRADARILFKLENDVDPTQSVELEQTVGIANTWTELTFDLRHADPAQLYQKIVLISDMGTVGDGSVNSTFFVDDIRSAEPTPPRAIPVHMYTTSRFAPGDADGNWLYIGLGSEDIEAENLIGMGFRIYVDTTLAVPTAYTTLGMFDDGMDEDFLDLFEYTDYGFGVSIVRTAGTNKLPYGPVIGVRFNVKTESEMLDLQIAEIEIRNAEGDLVPFHLDNYWISIPTRSTSMWPGDTNADGTVDVFDVEPIAYHFGAYGPAREDRTIQWMEVNAPLWDIREQVHADATGDGHINQNDLLPVGYNYGKSVQGPVAKVAAEAPVMRRPESIDIALPPLRKGEHIDIPLFADATLAGVADLRAFAFRLNMDATLIRIESIDPAAGFTVSGTMRMIKSEPEQNRYSAAYSRTPSMGSVDVDGPLAVLHLRALADLPTDAVVTIDRSMTSLGEARAMPARLFTSDGTITSVDDSRADIPSATRLDGNYPNPFNPTTMIAYALAADATTRLSVFDVLGREVAVLVDAHQSAGSYQVMFDATGLSSGLYLIRLQAGTETHTKGMTLIK